MCWKIRQSWPIAIMRSRLACAVFAVTILIAASGVVNGQGEFDKRPISRVDIAFTTGEDAPQAERFRLTASQAVGPVYSAPRIRDAIADLYATRSIDTIVVSASLDEKGEVILRFEIKRKTQVERVEVKVTQGLVGDEVREQDLLFQLNILTPGTPVTDQTLDDGATEILEYLRERGFYRSEVRYDKRQLANENQIGVTYNVSTGDQTTVQDLSVNIDGLAKPFPIGSLRLEKGGFFSRERLLSDVNRVREHLADEGFLAPQLEEPRVVYYSELNSVNVSFMGKVGPSVEVVIEPEKERPGSGRQRELLPIKREGTLDYSAIVEGERRLANYYQEQGYFFATATAFCSVEPQLLDAENNLLPNDTLFLCGSLGSQELQGRKVTVKYRVELDRQLKLTDIRIRGTNKIKIEDVRTILASQEANLLGIIPILGYGRGYTSETLLEEDKNTIESLMRELGYRAATVRVNQGVSLDGENLIITFVVEEGPPTVVEGVAITGNSAIPNAQLLAEVPEIAGRNYSRARTRNAARKLQKYYADRGYFDARVSSKLIDPDDPAEAEKDRVSIEFQVEGEGKQVEINRVLIGGNENTKESAVQKAITLKPGQLLKAEDIYLSEQNLYASDVFSRVEIKPEPAGDKSADTRLSDVLVNVDEQPSRLISYGGGYSTDLGLSGFFDLRYLNLFGRLWQGGARVKVSQRQQLVQLDYINPRFLRDGAKRWAPLTFSAGYQRDTTVTRFFRSALDEGAFGIVQRIDDEGNPIDQFGDRVGSPTINRLSFSAETNRTISRNDRSILFLRYRFEDVRLYNTESLLVKDLLRPDLRTRISGPTVTFVRDTRRNCVIKYSLLEIIAKGDPEEPCRYNASDPTHGNYLTADYSVSVPTLGASTGFHKFQATFNYYYTFPRLKNTTLAARAILGVGTVFSDDRISAGPGFESLDGLLPISERFFAGGSNNLRGFDYEEAGPRVVVVPQGTFRNNQGEIVQIDPFTIPFGGNALAVVNIEGRIPVSNSVRLVPFYDGGNVFRKARDVFRRPDIAPGDVIGRNQTAVWQNTVGLGIRIKTPIGGEFGVDYGHLISPPRFLIPQPMGPPAEYRLRQGHLHFRFSQAF